MISAISKNVIAGAENATASVIEDPRGQEEKQAVRLLAVHGPQPTV